jgi:hypothetical protein
MTTYRTVNWFDEGLDEYYQDNNNGLVHGIYAYEDDEDYPIDVQWFASEADRQNVLDILEVT